MKSLRPILGMEFLGKKRSFPLAACVLLGGFIFLYLSLFCLPAIPVLFKNTDASIYMFNACRMLRGKMIYRDFFQFTPPATETFYFFLFKIVGVHAWIPNIVLIGLGLGIAWLMIVISRNIIPGKAAYLPAALFLVIPFRSELDPTHHWFSTLAAMAAIALLVENITALRLFAAGALCGAAMCFTQSTGLPAALGLALFIVREATTHRLSRLNFRRAQLYIWSSFSLVVVLFNAYFVFKAGLRTFLSDTIVFGVRYWHLQIWNTLGAYMIDLPSIHPWYRLPVVAIWFSIYLLIPLIYILFFARYWDQKADRPLEPWDRLVLIAIVGIMLFLGVAAAPSWLRLCVVSPPGVILFVWFLNTPGRFRAFRATATWAIVIALALGECGELDLVWRRQLKLPTGRAVEIHTDQYEEIKFLLTRTRPGDYFFGNIELNFLLDLRNPSPVPFLTSSGYTRPEQVRETLQGLKNHHVKYILWSSDLDMPPEVAHTTNHLAPLRAYLLSHYQFVKRIEGASFSYNFWERRDSPARAAISISDGSERFRSPGIPSHVPRRGFPRHLVPCFLDPTRPRHERFAPMAAPATSGSRGETSRFARGWRLPISGE